MEISILNKPSKPQMNHLERFFWWKKMYYFTYTILLSVLIVPVLAYSRGLLEYGMKISIVLYLALLIIITWIRKVTEEKDIKFLEKQGIRLPINKKWWFIGLKVLFLFLKILIVIVLIKVWVGI